MSEAATAAVAQLFGEAFAMYAGLAASAAETEANRWALKPKHHVMVHIAYDNGCVNPRAAHCYDDEDMVGNMKRVYCKCHGVAASVELSAFSSDSACGVLERVIACCLHSRSVAGRGHRGAPWPATLPPVAGHDLGPHPGGPRRAVQTCAACPAETVHAA